MFVIILTSNSNASELRAAAQSAHDEYWSTRMDYIRFAGPMLSDDGETRVGQVMVVEAADKAEAEAVVLNDPFVKAGVFGSHTTRRFRLSVVKGASV